MLMLLYLYHLSKHLAYRANEALASDEM